jgi:hypothetical protein
MNNKYSFSGCIYPPDGILKCPGEPINAGQGPQIYQKFDYSTAPVHDSGPVPYSTFNYESMTKSSPVCEKLTQHTQQETQSQEDIIKSSTLLSPVAAMPSYMGMKFK